MPETKEQVGTEGGEGSRAEDRPVTVLLVDDQAIVGESVRRMLASEADVALHFCQDPTRALETANSVQPTVILQDLVMPEIDGLQLVKFFRANKATRDTPMIVLSSKEEPVVKAQAFALGANDYLVKLPDKLELIARIRYHSRAYRNFLERNEAFQQLEEIHRQLADEVAQAARYVQSLLPARLKEPARVEWCFAPSTQLGGDMFGYHWIDPDHLAIYLLDVSGHGVGSSLLAVSAANLLSAQSLSGTDFRDPGQVLSRLNDVFQMEKQNEKYFTIWYGVFRRKDSALAYCNAGHPAALLFSGEAPGAAVARQLDTTDPVIGMLPPGMQFETRVVPLQARARLVVCSDGAFEIHKPDGTMWTYSEYATHVTGLAGKEGPVGEALLGHVRGLHGADVLDDDFSVLEAWL
jgi:sigma-B regulation protein RsbU (phosphoserine phosphatase)